MGYSHGVYGLTILPHVDDAIWAIILAVGVVLLLVIDEMIKRRNTGSTPGNHRLPKKPGRRR